MKAMLKKTTDTVTERIARALECFFPPNRTGGVSMPFVSQTREVVVVIGLGFLKNGFLSTNRKTTL